MSDLGWIGMGEIGAPMALRLLGAGHRLSVWGRTRERLAPAIQRGASACETPHELAARCEAVFLCVTDEHAVEEVVFGPDGIARGAAPGKMLVDHSTIHPERCRELAARLRREAGMAWIDAPVSGGAAGARAGTLIVLAGGEQDEIERARSWLSAYAARVTHMGPQGSGQVAKACSQVVLATTVAVWVEALSHARRAGVDASTLIEALEGSWADSAARHHIVPHLVSARFQKRSIRMLLKDLEIAGDMARLTGSPMPLASLVTNALRQQVALGHEMDGLRGLMRLYETVNDPSDPRETT